MHVKNIETEPEPGLFTYARYSIFKCPQTQKDRCWPYKIQLRGRDETVGGANMAEHTTLRCMEAGWGLLVSSKMRQRRSRRGQQDGDLKVNFVTEALRMQSRFIKNLFSGLAKLQSRTKNLTARDEFIRMQGKQEQPILFGHPEVCWLGGKTPEQSMFRHVQKGEVKLADSIPLHREVKM